MRVNPSEYSDSPPYLEHDCEHAQGCNPGRARANVIQSERF
jgi:hypothetical protein